MAKRTSPLGEEGSKKLREAIKECNIKTMDDIHNFVKMLTAEANPWFLTIDRPLLADCLPIACRSLRLLHHCFTIAFRDMFLSQLHAGDLPAAQPLLSRLYRPLNTGFSFLKNASTAFL